MRVPLIAAHIDRRRMQRIPSDRSGDYGTESIYYSLSGSLDVCVELEGIGLNYTWIHCCCYGEVNLLNLSRLESMEI